VPLGIHKKDDEGRFRRERSDSKAKNLAADYPEFKNIPPETTLGQLEKKYGVESLDAVRREIKKRSK
jgi:hypothetical protein